MRCFVMFVTAVCILFYSLEIQITKTLAAMMDDRNNKAHYNSFVNGHPTWRR